MKKNTIKILASVLTLLVLVGMFGFLVSCGDGQDTTEPVDTTPLEERNHELVYNKKLGLTAWTVESSNPRVASGNAIVKSNGFRIVAHNEGHAVFTVRDYFGRSTTVEVDIGAAPDYKITFEAKPCDDKSIVDVKIDFNAKGTGSTNDTEAIQKAIDYGAEHGLDVCIPAGVYIIDKLELREGSVVRLQGKASDYIGEDCMNEENYQLLLGGSEFAVLRTSGNHKYMCINNAYQCAPDACNSNITFTGGVFDMKSNPKDGGVYSFVFSCAENITLEDTVMLDCYNEHTIQVSGCKNVTIKNCIFAGYVYVEGIQREALQVETAGKGCNGAVKYSENSAERIESADVLIEGCYFGPTPTNPAPPMGVGHHGANGHNGQTDCVNLTIKGCFFEDCGYAAIRQPNSEGLVIEDNTFVVEGRSNVVEKPSCIDLYILASNTTYKDSRGRTISISTADERYGVDAIIRNNTFRIEGNQSNFRVLQLTGSVHTVRGAQTMTAVFREDYTGGDIYSRSGFIVADRTFHDISFVNNKIDISARTLYNDAFVTAVAVVYGFECTGNDISTGTNAYSKSYNGTPGVSVAAKNGADAETRTIKSAMKRDIVFTLADGSSATLASASSESMAVTLKVNNDNGKLILTTDSAGKLYVSAEAKEGYVFDGWYTATGSPASIGGSVNAAVTYVAHFVAK